MNEFATWLMNEQNEAPSDNAINAIRRGQDTSLDDPNGFWKQLIEKFKEIPSEQLGSLFDINPLLINKISNNVSKTLDYINKENLLSAKKKRNKILKTGDFK